MYNSRVEQFESLNKGKYEKLNHAPQDICYVFSRTFLIDKCTLIAEVMCVVSDGSQSDTSNNREKVHCGKRCIAMKYDECKEYMCCTFPRCVQLIFGVHFRVV